MDVRKKIYQSWSTDITPLGWRPKWVLKNDGNMIGPNVYKVLVKAESIIPIDTLN